MATYTAGDCINRALRLLGVLAEGETPSASESSDALMAMNQMLDSWSTEQLAVYATTEQVLTWPANQLSRTLGPTGSLVGVRPLVLDDSTFFVINGVSYPLAVINGAEYNAIPVKGTTSPMPQSVCVNPTFPNATVYLYPVPSQAIEMHFVSATPLAESASTATVLSFPPGYMRAFVYCLAMELAPEFGVEPPRQVQRIANAAKRDIKRINGNEDVLSMPSGMIVGPTGYNIFTGN